MKYQYLLLSLFFFWPWWKGCGGGSDYKECSEYPVPECICGSAIIHCPEDSDDCYPHILIDEQKYLIMPQSEEVEEDLEDLPPEADVCVKGNTDEKQEGLEDPKEILKIVYVDEIVCAKID